MMRILVLLLTAVLVAALSFAEGPTFDVASVKVDTTDPHTRLGPTTGGPGTSAPGRFHSPRQSMLTLLMKAFGVLGEQIQGPNWIGGPIFYNIDATMPPDTTKQQFQKMLQNLLAERFHLVVRHETRNFPAYELVVDKGGAKIKEVTPDPKPADTPNPADTSDPRQQIRPPRGDDGFPMFTGSRSMTRCSMSGETWTKYQEQTMAEFASDLRFMVAMYHVKGVRIVDKTRLTGKYTFILHYDPAASSDSAPGGGSPAAGCAPGGPDIFNMIQKQLGLRLAKTADAPLEVIVVESVARTPTEN
jgi:uncharacterized protein (TIGR03435 family)